MIRFGTRTSALAWAQSGMVARLLGPEVELVGVETAGDRVVDAPLKGPLAKGWFTEALESALRDGAVDAAVHSLKDLPVGDTPGLVLGAILPRASPADVLLVREEAWGEGTLPIRAGARVGMSSPRRIALLRTVRPDCEPAWLRGNVTTRLSRLGDGLFDAIVLAEAGLVRLGAAGKLPPGVRCVRLDPRGWPPAPGQGALAVQCREGDAVMRGLLLGLHDPGTAGEVDAERAWLARLGGGCSVPFGALCAGEAWTVGLDGPGGFRVRRGVGTGAEAAVDALAAGGPGDEGTIQLWEAMDVGA